MKTRNLLMISAMAAALSFAAEEAEGPNAVEACQTAIDNASKNIPANATSAKYTLAAAKNNLIALDAAYNDDAESDQTKAVDHGRNPLCIHCLLLSPLNPDGHNPLGQAECKQIDRKTGAHDEHARQVSVKNIEKSL